MINITFMYLSIYLLQFLDQNTRNKKENYFLILQNQQIFEINIIIIEFIHLTVNTYKII